MSEIQYPGGALRNLVSISARQTSPLNDIIKFLGIVFDNTEILNASTYIVDWQKLYKLEYMHFDFFYLCLYLKNFKLVELKTTTSIFFLDLTHEKNPWIDERPYQKKKNQRLYSLFIGSYPQLLHI